MSDVYGAAANGHGRGGGGELHQQGQGHGDSPFCYFHPRELVVGICAHCLRERLLLVLASTHGAGGRVRSPAEGASYLSSRPYRALRRKTGSLSLPKVFALGSFLQRLDSSRHHRPDDDGAKSSDDASVASLDDSFISIKFEDNGKATWDGEKANAAKLEPLQASLRSTSSTTVVVAEHVKRGVATRWRKQLVGRLLQLARWKRSAKASGASAAIHVVGIDGKKAAAERSKGRGRSWIRSFTRRRAAHGERAWS